jgi:hypothetical protein
MRSSLVSSANHRLLNRFLLCRVTSVAARRLHRDRWQFAESINQALTHISDLESSASAAPRPVVPAGTEVPNISVDIAPDYATMEVR